jgi:hypothetical protein
MRHRSLLVRLALVAAALFCVGGTARADLIIGGGYHFPICPPAGCLPDLTVRYDEQNNQQGFLVINDGQYAAPTFHVAVLAGAESSGFDVPGLAAGAWHFYPVEGLSCGQAVTVIVNPFNAVAETNYNNNAASFYGWCGL